MPQSRPTIEELVVVVDNMAAAVTHCSRDLRYLWVSQPYAAWLGKQPEEIAGRSIVDVIGLAGWEGIRPYVEQVLSGKPVEYVDRVDFQGIGLRWIRAAYRPTSDGWIAVVTDIDDQKRAEAALQEADRRKDEFLAMLSHELRNPLASIMMATELLKAHNVAASRELRVIDQQISHLVSLVDDLLDVSRIATGKIEIRRRVVEVSELVTRVATMTRTLFEQHHQTLVVRPPDSGLRVEGDRDRLVQVLINLLNNASKFTQPGGTITLEAHGESDAAVISVTDNGTGMPPELLAHVFEAFVQGPTGRDRKMGGLGLGLTLVKRLTELHGGGVSAFSDGPGHGSRFTVRLPAFVSTGAVASDDVGARSRPRHVSDEPRPRHVLIVDDNQEFAEMVAAGLGTLGYATAIAHDGAKALRMLDKATFDVALVDIGLPGMDGFALARELRSRCPQLPLLALTGYGQKVDLQCSLEAGFEEHLTKPVDLSKLEETIAGLIRAHHALEHRPGS